MTTGTLSFSDPDYSDTHYAIVTDASVTGGVAPPASAVPDLPALLTRRGGAVDTVDGAGGVISYSFSGTENQFDYLAATESVAVTYTITVNDANGGTDTQDVTVTITGANDAPDVTVGGSDSATLALTELSEAPENVGLNAFTDTVGGGAPTTSGTLSFSDPDYSDTHTASVTNVSAGLGEVAPPSLMEAELLGLLQLTEPLVDTTDGAGGSITYTFAGQEDQFDYLAVGESVTLTYTITLEDNNGGTDTQDVAVTITGVNDAPDAVNDSFDVSEDAASVINAKTSVSTGSVLDNDTRSRT